MTGHTEQGDRWAIVARGLNGWHALSADGNTRSSGGTEAGYLADARDGALYYDADAITGQSLSMFANLVIAGPMPDPTIPGTDARTPYGEPCHPDAAGPLGSIGLAAYADALRAIPGVIVGMVYDGAPIVPETIILQTDDGTFAEDDSPQVYAPRLALYGDER